MALSDHIKHALAVADTAEASRQDMRWNVKPGDPERETQIAGLLEDIRLAMIPIRQAMGKAVVALLCLIMLITSIILFAGGQWFAAAAIWATTVVLAWFGLSETGL